MEKLQELLDTPAVHHGLEVIGSGTVLLAIGLLIVIVIVAGLMRLCQPLKINDETGEPLDTKD